MELNEQATRRVTLAREIGREPMRWIATPDAAAIADENGQLLGLPLEVGQPRSEWGLDLVSAPVPA